MGTHTPLLFNILTRIYIWNYPSLMTTRLPLIQPEACTRNPIDPPALSEQARGEILAVFKALSDATRFEVFRFIAAQEAPICACDIVDRFDVSQPTIAHHLKVLRDSHLITAERSGVWMHYVAKPNGKAMLASTSPTFADNTGQLVTIG